MIRDAKLEMGTETHKETNQLPLLACSFCIPKKILPISGCQSIKCEQTLRQEKKNTPPKSNIDTKNGHILKGVRLFQGPSTFGALQPLVFQGSEGHRKAIDPQATTTSPVVPRLPSKRQARKMISKEMTFAWIQVAGNESICPTLGKLKIIIFKRPLGREYLRLHLSWPLWLFWVNLQTINYEMLLLMLPVCHCQQFFWIPWWFFSWSSVLHRKRGLSPEINSKKRKSCDLSSKYHNTKDSARFKSTKGLNPLGQSEKLKKQKVENRKSKTNKNATAMSMVVHKQKTKQQRMTPRM